MVRGVADREVSLEEKTTLIATKLYRWVEAEVRKRRQSNFFGSVIIEIPFANGQITAIKRSTNEVLKADDNFQ
jgi:hypothetical protein